MKHVCRFVLLITPLAACASNSRYRTIEPGTQQFALGIHNVDPETDGVSSDEALGVTLEYSRFLREDDRGRAGVDVILAHSVHDVSFQVVTPTFPFIETRFEEATNLKLAVGGRFEFALEDDRFRPWARGGLVYQYFYDDIVDDDGFGLFVGAGLDYELAEEWAIGPALWYSTTKLSDFDVDEFALGLRMTHTF